MKNKSFFKKTLVSFILLVILYTGISAILIVRKNREILNHQIKASQESFMEMTTESTDNRLNMALSLLDQLIRDEDIIQYVNNSDIDYLNVTTIFHKLQELGTIYSDLNFTLAIAKPNENLIITPSRTIDKNSFYESFGYSKETVDFIDTLNQQDKGYRMELNIFDSKDYITLAVREKITFNGIANFYIIFEKSSFLPEISDRELFGIIFKDKLVTTLNPGDLSIENFEQISELAGVSSTHTNQKDENETLHLSRSDILHDLNYLYGDYRQNHPLTSQGFLQVFISVVVLLVLGSILAIVLTGRAYRPMGRLLNFFEENNIGNSTLDYKNDEFEYIEENFRHVKKNNDNLRKVLQNNTLFLKESFLKNLLNGVLSKKEIEEGVQQYDLLFLNDSLRVMVIEFKDRIKLEKDFPVETIYQIKKQILKRLQLDLSEKFTLEIFEVQFLQYGMVIKEKDTTLVISTLRSSFLSIEEAFNLALVGGVGKVVENKKDLKASFDSSIKILENQFAIGEKSIITEEDLLSIKESSYYYPIEKERELIIYFVQGDKSKSLEILNALLEENEGKGLSSKDQYQFVHAIANTFNRIVQMTNVNSEFDLSENNMLAPLLMSDNYQEFSQKVKIFFIDLIENVETTKEQQGFEKNNDISNFISENYQEDISLQDLAEHLNLSITYTSTLFKKVTGVNFKDYLNLYRIEKAKEILLHSNKLVREISTEVGFTNVNSFIRVFKKYEGISPGQYTQRDE